MRARQYDPSQGRFTSEDPLAPTDTAPVTLDPYAYAGDMPTEVTDPSGQGWVEVSGPGYPAGLSDLVIRQRIRNQFVHLDTSRLSSAPFQFNGGVSVDLLSLGSRADPQGYSGEVFDILRSGADQTARGAELNAATLVLANSSLIQGVLKNICRRALPALLRLRRGVGYPDTFNTLATRSQPGITAADQSFAFPVAGDNNYPTTRGYMVDVVQGAPGFIAYKLCRWVEGAGNALCSFRNSFNWNQVIYEGYQYVVGYDIDTLVSDPSWFDKFGAVVDIASNAVAVVPGAGELDEGAKLFGEAALRDAIPSAGQQGFAFVANVEALGKDGVNALLQGPGKRIVDDALEICDLCFPAGTLVATPHGKRPIEQLRKGDKVLAEDPKTGAVDVEPVLATFADPVSPLVAVDLSDGTTIKVTASHHFFVERGRGLGHAGWLSAGELRPGDRLRTASGRDVTVFRVRWNVGDAHVYTLTVAHDHTFFAGAAMVLVHNTNQCHSRELNNRMVRANIQQPRPGSTSAHHLVAWDKAAAQPARDVLAHFGIDVDDAVNGVYLPIGQNSPKFAGFPNARIHGSLHTDLYFATVNDTILRAAPYGREAVLLALGRIRADLLTGRFPR